MRNPATNLVKLILATSVLTTALNGAELGLLTYELTPEGAIITGCDIAAKEVELPQKIGVVPVTAIGSNAFQRCGDLVSITLPISITSIGNHAFFGCSSLTSITIPEGVTTIEIHTFTGCSSLTSIHLPNSLINIEYGSFEACRSLTSINIPDGVTSIGGDAFSYCGSLTSINLPSSVNSIGNNAFRQCVSLESITIPKAFHSRVEALKLGPGAYEIYPWGFHLPRSPNMAQPSPSRSSIRMAPVIMVKGEEGFWYISGGCLGQFWGISVDLFKVYVLR